MKFSTIFDLKEKRSELQRMKALQEAKKLSIVLAEQFPYERAYLFGSVLKKGRFTRHSDIDIVIKGLDETLFLKAYAFLLGESNFPVDLKPWELVDEHTRKKVEEEGVVLHGKG
ncbi:MAG: nucleotidyltransferase domain-containing protein [Candidatus Aminicenantes bacterium]|nr:MAG: nucleotidyltransferase domain-containing protein [Candidatus Aminicenantes bacterium]